jgi:hypothetical protein
MRSRPDRVLLVVVAVAVALAVVTAVFAATRPTQILDRTTPQGSVQAYLTAVLDRDNAKAASFFAPGSPCSAQDLDRAYVADATRVDLVSQQVDSDTARVTVEVSIGSGSGPFAGVSGEQHTFRLTRSGSAWRLDGIPWPAFDCGLGAKS